MVFLGDRSEQGVWVPRSPIRGIKYILKDLWVLSYGRDFSVGKGEDGWEVDWDHKPTRKEFIKKLKDFQDSWYTRDSEMEDAEIFIMNADIILNANEGFRYLDKLFNEHGGY